MLIQAEEVNTGVSIELTPMIDMVFLLLIFFLVATTFRQEEREMQIALPFAASAAPISSIIQDLIINIDAEGKIVLGGRTLNAAELRNIITTAVVKNPEQKITVRGDRGTAYANIVTVLDICKDSGIQEPYLDTAIQD